MATAVSGRPSTALRGGNLITTQPFLAILSLSLLTVTPCVQAQSRPELGVQVSNGAVRLRLAADVGSACTIQCATTLAGTTNWQFLTNLTPLVASPYDVADSSAMSPLRVYRAFSQQVPTNFSTTNMVWIPPGTFVMGSPANEMLRNGDEAQHTVTFTRGFFIGKYEVTQGEFEMMLKFNPSKFQSDTNRPVEQVSWSWATNYCWALTLQEHLAGKLPTNWVYRLPTESEWEYACRAETTTAFHYGNGLHGGMANFSVYYEYDAAAGEIFILHPTVPYLNQTAVVGRYQPNAWGLYDTHGNVWEWCQDWYGDYPAGSVTDPQGPASGSYRVKRGGGWQSSGSACRAAIRQANIPSYSHATAGFRLVLAQLP